MALAPAPGRRSTWSALTGLVACVVLLSSCSAAGGSGAGPSTPETAAETTAESAPTAADPEPRAGRRIDFTIPSGWEELDDPARFSPSLAETEEIEDLRTVVGPATEDGSPLVVVITVPSTQPLEEVMKGVWSGFGAEAQTDSDPVTVAGQAAVRSAAERIVNGVDVTSVAVVVEDGDTRHTMNLVTPTSTVAPATAAFDGLLESVTLAER